MITGDLMPATRSTGAFAARSSSASYGPAARAERGTAPAAAAPARNSRRFRFMLQSPGPYSLTQVIMGTRHENFRNDRTARERALCGAGLGGGGHLRPAVRLRHRRDQRRNYLFARAVPAFGSTDRSGRGQPPHWLRFRRRLRGRVERPLRAAADADALRGAVHALVGRRGAAAQPR